MLDSYYTSNNGTLYNGDCLEILQQLPKNPCEIAVTSPPYNLCKRYTNYKSTKTSARMSAKFDQWYDDELPEWLYQGQQQSVVHELLRICKSSVFYNHKIRYAWHSRNIYRNETNIFHPMQWLSKFPIRCEIIWDRCGINNPTNRYHSCDERIYQIGKPKKWNNKHGLTNIWRIPPSKNTGHVCSFPEKLVENCIIPTTEENDIIIDPFAGSGTVAVVAEKLNRKWVLIEKDEKYCEIIAKRLTKYA